MLSLKLTSAKKKSIALIIKNGCIQSDEPKGTCRPAYNKYQDDAVLSFSLVLCSSIAWLVSSILNPDLHEHCQVASD